MNYYTKTYLQHLHIGIQKAAAEGMGGKITQIGRNLRTRFQNYKPFRPENLSTTGRWLGGVAGIAPGAILGGAIGTMGGWMESPSYDPQTGRRRPQSNWFVRGLKGGLKGSLIGGAAGAGLGAWGGNSAFPSFAKDFRTGYLQKDPIMPQGAFGLGPLERDPSSRKGILNAGKNLSMSDLGQLVDFPTGNPNVGEALTAFAMKHPELASRMAGDYAAVAGPDMIKRILTGGGN